MKVGAIVAGAGMGVVILTGVWIIGFHGEWVKPGTKPDEDEVHVATEVPVHVAKAKRATLHRYVDGFGTVSAEPAREGRPAASSHLASPVAGVLAQSMVAEGQRVERGATLFQLDPRAASAEEQRAMAAKTSAKATVERLESQVSYEQTELERTRKLHDQGLSSDKDLHDAELRLDTAKNELLEGRAKVLEADKSVGAATTGRALLAIKAPISGTVVRIFVNPGEAVDTNPATVIADIVDLDRLVVAATLPAADLPLLAVGQPVDLTVAESTAAPVHGSLAFIGYEVDTKTDTIPIRVSFPRDAGLRPGQYLRIRIAVDTHEDAIAVPSAAVVKGEGEGWVVAVVEGDNATQRPVEVGIRDGDLVEVKGEGIKEGVTVVTAGAYGLPKETKVKIAGEAKE